MHAADDVPGLRGQILEVYEGAWAPTPFSPTAEQLQDFDVIIERHSRQDRFRLAAAYDEEGLAGFAYGYTSVPGGWWRDIVTTALDPDAVEGWFSDAFEFVELAVHPRAQQRGAGRRLHDDLLAGVGNRTAVLSTQVDNVAARRLYRARGWRVLERSFMFPNRSYPYMIMGLHLASPPESAVAGGTRSGNAP